MSAADGAILIVAKSPIPGVAKTRLAATFGPEGAADLAAAALLDTLLAVRSADVGSRILALSGELSCGRRSSEIRALLTDFTVIRQRGTGFAERLCHAHRDAASQVGAPLLQIGMDTPQVTSQMLTEAVTLLDDPATDAVLGPASDGGWWALGLADPQWASVLHDVPMSRADTGAATLRALRGIGRSVASLPSLTDVDTVDDVWRVADELGAPSHFRRAAQRLRPVR